MTRFIQTYFGRFWLAAVYLFLYIPLFFLIVFSFNSTRQDGVFTGFSLRWYTALMGDSRLVEGFFLSLKVAVITGTLSVILGAFAAFVLVRYVRFKGRTLFAGLVSAPLVMPEVIIGLSLLLLMVAVQRAIGWATPCWAWPTPPWSFRAACARWTAPWKKPPWTWAAARSRCFFWSPCPTSRPHWWRPGC